MVDLWSSLVTVLGPRPAKTLEEAFGMRTVEDLLRHYPRAYQKLGELTDIRRLIVGERVAVLARVVQVESRKLRPGARVKTVQHVRVTDGNSFLTCTFFNQPWMEKAMPVDLTALFEGVVKEFNGRVELTSSQVVKVGSSPAGPGPMPAGDPTWEGSGGRDDLAVLESFAGMILPVYPSTKSVAQIDLQRLIHTVLMAVSEIPEPLPEQIRAAQGLVDLDTALRDIHRPASLERLELAKARIRYDEALAVQLVLAQRRHETRMQPAEPCPHVDGGLLDEFDRNLPFQLTEGQQQVGADLARELSTIHPMNRLLQGEVGSGKTVVALRAMLQVIDNGRQAVLLAPTEVLAAQHVRSLRQMLGPYARGGELGAPDRAIKVTLLTGSLRTKARREALLDIVSGQAGIIVGTHALLSDDVFFFGLGLVVVDEQHRFGVEQRDVLRRKHPGGNPPHVLVMTATPIPRTVAMTAFGDLEVSTLEGLPAGRSPISTTVVPAWKQNWVDRAWQRVREEVAKGHQAYIVCPKIGDEPGDPEQLDDDDDPAPTKKKQVRRRRVGDDPDREPKPIRDVLSTAAELTAGPLAGLRVAVLHGRLTPEEKDEVMGAFGAGEVQVLVATTVIEVGVDVPNATMMVILDAERFGMSQLHQLRGRVGRGSAPGLCLLISDASPGSTGGQRLAAVAATTDGFELALTDLELRREGDVVGTTQSGQARRLRQLSIIDHTDVIEAARSDAENLVADDPQLRRWPGLATMVAAMLDEQSQDNLQKG